MFHNGIKVKIPSEQETNVRFIFMVKIDSTVGRGKNDLVLSACLKISFLK